MALPRPRKFQPQLAGKPLATRSLPYPISCERGGRKEEEEEKKKEAGGRNRMLDDRDSRDAHYQRSVLVARFNTVFIRQVHDLVPPTTSASMKRARNRTRGGRGGGREGGGGGYARSIKKDEDKKKERKRGRRKERKKEREKRRERIHRKSFVLPGCPAIHASQCTGCVQIRVFVWEPDCGVKYTMTLNRAQRCIPRASARALCETRWSAFVPGRQ